LSFPAKGTISYWEGACDGSWILSVLLLLAISGCIAVGGTDNNNRPTRGQELVDLKLALDRGAISQAEYDTTKARIMNR